MNKAIEQEHQNIFQTCNYGVILILSNSRILQTTNVWFLSGIPLVWRKLKSDALSHMVSQVVHFLCSLYFSSHEQTFWYVMLQIIFNILWKRWLNNPILSPTFSVLLQVFLFLLISLVWDMRRFKESLSTFIVHLSTLYIIWLSVPIWSQNTKIQQEIVLSCS